MGCSVYNRNYYYPGEGSLKSMQTEKDIRELLDQATPGPWHYELDDGCFMDDLAEILTGSLHTDSGKMVLGSGLEINNDQEIKNLTLATLAPELAADWLRLRKELNELVEDLNSTALCTGRSIAKHIEKILNNREELGQQQEITQDMIDDDVRRAMPLIKTKEL